MPSDLACWLRRAYAEAAKSGDTSTRVGAVLVAADGTQIGAGCNDIYPACCDAPDRRVRPAKYRWVAHAELTAVGEAVRLGRGGQVPGATLYASWAACADCAKAIALSGVVRLVRHVRPDGSPWMSHGDWVESAAVGDAIMRAAGVELVDVATALGCVARLDGAEIRV